jgi:hypothetical protein
LHGGNQTLHGDVLIVTTRNSAAYRIAFFRPAGF